VRRSYRFGLDAAVWTLAVALLVLGSPAAARAQGGIDPASLAGLVQDDAAAKVEGTWTKSVHTKPFLGAGYLYA
jgi:hypothetical protein